MKSYFLCMLLTMILAWANMGCDSSASGSQDVDSRIVSDASASDDAGLLQDGAAADASAVDAGPSCCTTCSPVPMPTARSALGLVTTTDGRLFAIGGLNDTGFLATNEAYDLCRATWSTRAPLPKAIDGHAAVAEPDGRVYVIGGSSEDGMAPLATVYVYSFQADAWTTAAPMPTARWGHTAVAGTDGRVYVIGGEAGDYNYISTVEVYDPKTDSWTTAAPMPTARSGHGAAMGLDGRIYVMGGYYGSAFDQNATLNVVEAYDPSTDQWATVAPLPTARDWLAAAAAPDGRIWAIGGHTGARTGASAVAVVEAYDATLQQWTAEPSLPRGVVGGRATTGTDGRIYLVGGASDSGYLAAVETYSPGDTAWVP